MNSIEFQTFDELKEQIKPIIIENDRVLKHKYVLPGDCITTDLNYMRGHGTYQDDFIEDNYEEDVNDGENDDDHMQPIIQKRLVSSLAGIVEPINRLISVRPLRTRYVGSIGDVVIGRIIDVQQKRWKVETNSRLSSILQLSSVNLPGGELRRRTSEDELVMRQYLSEGDLICAEVQTIYEDGSLGLYTRSLKYGKLGQGLIIQVSPSMIAKRKIHTHNLPFGVFVVLGNNGLIFVSVSDTTTSTGGFIIDQSIIPYEQRLKISRIIFPKSQNKKKLNSISND
ncbi:exosome complex component RRP4-like protein [Sarcoptes scabiei]|uniref:Exosome complex component RRP4-like protein n=1 Tax=Sarcoptes scabiei TaxID=52283 RepID=A0A131ZW80_SARSC|nr:exosome complex component RRP4-like protein [Sarcoptes scabiei]